MKSLDEIQFVCAVAGLIASGYMGYEFCLKPPVKRVTPAQIASQAAFIAFGVCAAIREASSRPESFWWIFFISVVFLMLISFVLSYWRLYRTVYPRPSGKLKDGTPEASPTSLK
jgi:hypothetical protein